MTTFKKIVKVIKHYTLGDEYSRDKRVRRTNGTIARKIPVRDYGNITGYIYL